MCYLTNQKVVSLDQQKTRHGVKNTAQHNYYFEHLSSSTPNSSSSRQVEIVNDDCLEVARKLLVEGRLIGEDRRVGVLNMACRSRAGGGYRNGAGAQEENLFRRSNLVQHLENTKGWCRHPVFYPLEEFSVVHSPNVTVFRGPESEGYPFLDTPYFVDILSAAAYNKPETILVNVAKNDSLLMGNCQSGYEIEESRRETEQSDSKSDSKSEEIRETSGLSYWRRILNFFRCRRNHTSQSSPVQERSMDLGESTFITEESQPEFQLQLEPHLAECFKYKIYTLLYTAEMKGIHYLVLSAWGCGAFRNPPNHVAQLFKEVIDSYFPRSFTKIVFAIIEDHNSRDGNVSAFQRVFSKKD